LIQTALESISFGVKQRDFALTETPEPQLDHGSRRWVLPDAQQLGYRPACCVWIACLGDGIQYLSSALCCEKDSVQKREPLSC
jgi:hypothetical protein